MINCNICPTVLTPEATDDPKEFEKNHMLKVRKIKELSVTHCNSTKILKETVKRYRANLPWNMVHDGVWRKYLEDWKSFIYPFLDKCITSVNVEGEIKPCSCLAHLAENENLAWVFLNDNLDKFSPGVPVAILALNPDCRSGACDPVTESNFEEKIKTRAFPWIEHYNHKLPTSGQYPFIPPKNWHKIGVVLKGSRNGWMDEKGNEWVHDTERKDHWDVQLKDNSHINVNYRGDIIS